MTSEDFADKGKKAVGRELTDIPFEAWVTFVFDHLVPDADMLTWGERAELSSPDRGMLNMTATGGIHLVNRR